MTALTKAPALRRAFHFRLGRIHVLILLLFVELGIFGALNPAYLSVSGLLDASRAYAERVYSRWE
jgi:hypothetical protein